MVVGLHLDRALMSRCFFGAPACGCRRGGALRTAWTERVAPDLHGPRHPARFTGSTFCAGVHGRADRGTCPPTCPCCGSSLYSLPLGLDDIVRAQISMHTLCWQSLGWHHAPLPKGNSRHLTCASSLLTPRVPPKSGSLFFFPIGLFPFGFCASCSPCLASATRLPGNCSSFVFLLFIRRSCMSGRCSCQTT